MSKEEKRTRDIMPSDPTDPNEADPQSDGGQEADNVDRSKVLDDLGATDVPDMQSDIHVLTIIGQVETKPPNMSMLFRNWWRWRKARRLRACWWC